MEESLDEAKLQLEKEEEEIEKTISGIATQVRSSIACVVYLYMLFVVVVNLTVRWFFSALFLPQTKEIEDKILHFEEIDLQMEKKLQQFEQLQNQLFVDQLTILFNKNAPPKTGSNVSEPVTIE